MATISWNVSYSGDWDDAADWNTGAVPGALDDAVLGVTGSAIVQNYTVTATQSLNVNSITFADNGAELGFAGPVVITVANNIDVNGGDIEEQNGGGLQVGGNLILVAASNAHSVFDIDTHGSGSTASISGAVQNAGTISIGNYLLGSATTVTANALTNTGTINITGDDASGNQAVLDILGAAPTTMAGALNLGGYDANPDGAGGNALLEFGSGEINAIALGGSISISNPNSFIADANNTGSSSALTGLTDNAGFLGLQYDVPLSLSGNLTNTGTLELDQTTDYGDDPQGGSTLTIGGILTNSYVSQQQQGIITVGNIGLSAPTTLIAASLNNTGTINLTGDNASGHRATIDILGAAPTTMAGALNIGGYDGNGNGAGGNALLEFGSGEITTIAYGGSISISNPNSFIADANQTGSNSALTGLTDNAGFFGLQYSVPVSIGGNLTNTGTLELDQTTDYNDDPQGGSTLTIAGTLTNTYVSQQQQAIINVGNPLLTTPTTLSAAALDNTGTINLTGNWGSGTTEQAAIDIAAAAPTSWTGSLNISGDAVLQYGSGSIDDIASGAAITLGAGNPGVGAQSFIANAGDPDANSALTDLSSIEGYLGLEDGEVVNLAGNLNNSGTLGVDEKYFPYPSNTGASVLTIAGTLTNSGTLDFGNGNLTAPTTITASDLDNTNTGIINLYGNTTGNTAKQITFDVAHAAPTTFFGSLNMLGDAVLEFASGSIQAIAANAEITIGSGNLGIGAQSFIADSSNTGESGALSGLTTNAGYLGLEDSAVVSLAGSFTNTGTIGVDDERFPYPANTGGSKLTIAGTWINSGTATIGWTGGSLAAPTTVTAGALDDTGGTINLTGNFSSGTTNQATLDILSAAPTSWTSTLNIAGDAVLEFSSGSIADIAANGAISLGGGPGPGSGGPGDGLQSFIDDANDPTPNDALSQLVSIEGSLRLEDGVAVTLSGSLNNSGTLDIDDESYWYNAGDSTLSIAGALTNSGALNIGNGGLSASTTVTAAALDDTSSGTIYLFGNWEKGTTNQATLDILGAAPTTWTGTLYVTGDALLDFGSGSITDISSTGSIYLGGGNGYGVQGSAAGAGLQSFIADASNPTVNGALSGLASNEGLLQLENGAAVSLSGNLNNSGTVNVDQQGYVYVAGGSQLTVAGTLTNSGTLNIGNGGLSSSTTVEAGGLANTGTIDLQGNTGSGTTDQATLDIAGAATATVTNTIYVRGDALLEFGSGAITAVAGFLEIDGGQAVVSIGNGAPDAALNNIDSVTGRLLLRGNSNFGAGAEAFNVGGSLDVSSGGELDVDEYGGDGGTTLSIAGALTNSGLVIIGNGGASAVTTITVGSLDNTNTLDVYGNAFVPGSLEVLGSATNTGTLTIGNAADVGVVGTFVDSGTINLGGALDIASPLDIASGGTLVMQDGTVIDPTGGAITVASGATISGHGVINVPLTNNGTVTATGGLLQLEGPVTGSGSFDIGGGSEIEIAGGISGGTFSFNNQVGTLKVDNPAGFSDSITGIVSGDTIDLAGIQVTSAVVSGSTMTVTAGTQVLNYSVSGPGLNGTNVFAIQGDQNGGTDLTLGTPGPTISGPTSQTAFLGWPSELGPFTIADPTAGASLLTVTITAGTGVLAGFDVSGNALPGSDSNQLTLTGDLADINTMLASFYYLGPSAGASDNVRVFVQDAGSLTAAQTVTVQTGTVPYTPPELNGADDDTLVWGASTAIGGVSVSDPYAQTTSSPIAIELSSDAGTAFTANGTGGTVFGQNSQTVAVIGTPSAINDYFADDMIGTMLGATALFASGTVGVAASNLKDVYTLFTFAGTGDPKSGIDLFTKVLTQLKPVKSPGVIFTPEFGMFEVGTSAASFVLNAAAAYAASYKTVTAAEFMKFETDLFGILAGKLSFLVVGKAQIVTAGGLTYQFNADGAFVLTESAQPGDTFQVQIAMQPDGTSQSASMITGIAAAVGTDRVTFAVGRSDTVFVDGSGTAMTTGQSIQLSGGQLTELAANTYQIAWNSGEILQVVNNNSYLDLGVELAADDGPGTIAGLMGTNNGTAGDFTLPNGTVLSQPLTAAQLYGTFASAWAVTPADSLFDAGTPIAFNPTFPAAVVSLANLPASVVALAAQAVSLTGLTDPNLIAGAEFDYIESGGNLQVLADDGAQFKSLSTTPADITPSPTPTVLGVIAAQPSVTEATNGATQVTFDVYLTEPVGTPVTVDYAVIDPDAGDLDAAAFGGALPTGSITIPANQAAGTLNQITIDVPQGALGGSAEGNVALRITTPDGVPIFAPVSQEQIVQAIAGPPAQPQLEYLSTLGTFTRAGNNYTLDLGDIPYGQLLPQLEFSVANAASPPADQLTGTFVTSPVAGFVVADDSIPTPINPGDSYQALTLDVNEDKFGPNDDTITFDPVDTNASGYSSPLSPITLTIDYGLQIPNTMYSQAFGDVHIITYSGQTYDFQAAGEFILAQSQTPGDSFQIQLRLQPYTTSSTVTFITQVAISLGTDDVTFGTGGLQPITVRDGGQLTTLSMADPTLTLSGGTITEESPSMYKVVWNTGETMTVNAAWSILVGGGYFLNVSDSAPNIPGSVIGLQTGQGLPSTTCDLYGSYADDWRVTAANSLFYYTPGESTATFTVPGFPSNQVSLLDIPASVLAAAQAAVAAAGITDPNLAQQAELDYLATGNLNTVNAGANANQQASGTSAVAITPCSPPATAIGVMAAATNVTEVQNGETAVTFTAYLTGTEATDTTVDYMVTAPGAGFFSAAAFGGTLPSGSVDITAGQTTAQFTIDLPEGALGSDPSENLQVEVSSPGNALPVFAPTAQTEVDNPQPTSGTPAQPVLAYLGNVGTFTFDSQTNTYTLNLGGVVEGAAALAAEFAVINAAIAPADNLSGTFGAPIGQGFTVTGNALSAPLGPGEAYDGLYTEINTFELGNNDMSLTFDPTDVNDSGYSQSLAPITLDITDHVAPAANAQVDTPTTIIFPKAHVGATETQHVSVVNTGSSGAAGLDVTLTASGNAIASGSVTQLAPGTTDASHLTVGIDTSSAGALAGSVTENFVSDAGGGVTSPIAIEDPYIDVFGDVYRLADPTVQPNNLTVKVGASGAQTLTITNADPDDGYSEKLIATVVGTTGGVHATGTTGDIAAGSAGTIGVTFSTASAGAVGTVTLDLISDGGTGSGSIDGLGQTDLGDVTIPVSVTTGPVPAVAQWEDLAGGGTLTQSGSVYTLTFGTISTLTTIQLGVRNEAALPADTLGGGFVVSGPINFENDGFSAFSGIAGGAVQSGLEVTLIGAEAGSFSETITLNPVDQNGTTNPALAPETLIVTGTVIPCYTSPDPTLNLDSYVSGGVTLSSQTVPGGTNLEVLYGAETTGAMVSGGGIEMIYGSASATVVSAGGADYVESGGVGYATDLTMCTNEFVLTSGYASGTVIENEAQEFVSGLTSNAVISSAGLQSVEPGYAVSTTIWAGGEQYIGSGGTAYGTQIEPGGGEVMFGSDSDAVISGTQYVFGVAISGTSYDAADQQVQPGGTGLDTTIESGGIQYIGIGGTTSAALVEAGGAEIIFGSDVGGALVSGTQYDFGTASGGTMFSGSLQQVQPGGTALGPTVENGAQLYIGSGGVASGAVIEAGGAEVIFGSDLGAMVSGTQYDFAYASGGTTYDGASQEVGSALQLAGAIALSMTVAAGGQQYIGTGATALATDIEGQGVEIVFGSDSGAQVSGTQYLFSIASGGTTFDGGTQEVEFGATALGMTVSSGGVQNVGGGGTAIGTQIMSQGAEIVHGTDLGATISGTQYVDGVASGSLVGIGGYQLVSAGGTISGASISGGGTLELMSGASDGAAPITFAGAGELILDASQSFSGTVADFGLSDAIDLADIPYVSSGPGATMSSWTPGNGSGTLAVSEGGQTANITLLGQYAAGNFNLVSDNHGGTLVLDPPLAAATDPNPLVLTTTHA